MKTIVVISDTHGKKEPLQKIAPLFAENDYIVHLGDGSADMRNYALALSGKTFICRGNCDPSYGEEELVIEAEGTKIFCCHGDKYGVKYGLGRLAARAKELGCDAALYGHTHTACIEYEEDILCLNPGALGSYTEPSYGYIGVHEGHITAVIVPLR